VEPLPSPAELRERVRSAYAACRSYRDVGTVTTPAVPSHGAAKVCRFATVFERPGRFVFRELYSLHGEPGPRQRALPCRAAAWSDGRSVWYWRSGRRPRAGECASPEDALRQLSGLTSCASEHVMPLLLGVHADPWKDDPRRRVVRATDAGREVLRVDLVLGNPSFGTTRWSTWVDPHTCLLRGWELESERPDAAELASSLGIGDPELVRRVEEAWTLRPRFTLVLRIEPELDPRIDPAELRFAPPP
jgi:hypothetical protein